MIEQFISYIEYYIPLSKDAKNELLRDCEIQKIKKGDLLLSMASVCDKLFFSCDGTARSYYHLDGKDVTTWIYVEYSLFTSWYSFYKQERALENIEAISDMNVVSITYNKLQALFEKHPDLERFGRLEMQEQIAFVDKMNHDLKFLTAKQKYDMLLKMYPSITSVARLGHIASMLDISQETLSRIRKHH